MATTPNATKPVLYADNDFAEPFTLFKYDPITLVKTKLTDADGPVTAEISTSPLSSVAPTSIPVTIAYVSAKQKWVVTIDRTELGYTALQALFASAVPYLVINQPGGLRAVFELAYAPVRYGVVTSPT